jgi:hypothetical protein
MAAGAVYHAALAKGDLGFAVDRLAKNGTFELAGIDDKAIPSSDGIALGSEPCVYRKPYPS